MNAGPGSVRLPSAVAFSSSSESESDSASYSGLVSVIWVDCAMCSFELVMTWSSSLSLSSYSSWLLVPVCKGCEAPGCALLRLRVSDTWCTRRPVVTISSPREDSEEEDGCEDISTHDSSSCEHKLGRLSRLTVPSFRNLGGIPADRAIASVLLCGLPLLCEESSRLSRKSSCWEGAMFRVGRYR